MCLGSTGSDNGRKSLSTLRNKQFNWHDMTYKIILQINDKEFIQPFKVAIIT